MGIIGLPTKLIVVQQGDTVPPTTPTVWTDLTRVLTVTGFELVRMVKDSTTLGPSLFADQTPTRFEPFNPTLTCVYDQASYQEFRNLLVDTSLTGPLQWWRFVLPDTYWQHFEAFVTKVGDLYEMDDYIKYEVILSGTQEPFFDNV